MNDTQKAAVEKPQACTTKRYVRPHVNILKKEDGFTIEMALPGVSKEDVSMMIKDQLLTIESVDREVEDSTSFNRREFNFTHFKRAFTLPEDIDSDHVEAQLAHGVLSITLVKRPEVMPKKINIQ